MDIYGCGQRLELCIVLEHVDKHVQSFLNSARKTVCKEKKRRKMVRFVDVGPVQFGITQLRSYGELRKMQVCFN